MRPKSLKSAKPFSRYSTLKIDRKKKDRKAEYVVFLEVLQKLKNNSCVTSDMINAQFNNDQSQIFPSVELIRT